MNWLRQLEKWNCAGFIANCKKRKKINQFIFKGKEYNGGAGSLYRIHRKNEESLEEFTAYQNLIIDREQTMLSYGYFSRDEIITRRSEHIQQYLDFELFIDESPYQNRSKTSSELCLGFWGYTEIDFKVLKKNIKKGYENGL